MKRFPALDGVRALAAVMVIVFHFAGPQWSFLSGWLGVHLFFVLSGFLITTLLLREEAAHGRISLVKFWIRRLFRILPAYYAVLALTLGVIALQGTVGVASVWAALPYSASMNPDLGPVMPMFVHAWTIGIEQKFYLVWPVIGFTLVAGVATRRAWVWLLSLLTLIAVMLVQISAVHFVVILFGCGLAMALNSPRSFRWLRMLTTRIGAAVALIALIAVQLSAGKIIALSGNEGPLILLYGLAAALALPGLLAQTRTVRILSLAPLRWLGDRSYSLYLVQVLGAAVVIGLLPAQQPGITRAFLVILVSAIIADVLYRAVELPGIRLGKALATRRRVALFAKPLPGRVLD